MLIFKKKVNKEVNLEFWDCSGSSEYIYFVNMLFHEANYIFLCFDISELTSYESIHTFWLSFLIENNVNSKIFIIGTKNDLVNDFEINYQSIVDSKYELSLNIYPKIMLLSAKNDNNNTGKIQEIINEIIQNN